MQKEELNKLVNELKENLGTIRKYDHALSLMYFDFETIAPEKAREDESAVLDFFSNELFKLRNSERNKELIVEINKNKDL